ncbi:hypothetical protein ACP70R_013154 [Stipagrostis hirtigluma subsp. patula]
MATAMRKLAVVVVLAAALLVAAGGASAATCNASELRACVPALTTGVAPTAACCAGMRAQKGCLCEFAKNPKYGRYLGPNARRTLAACAISLPRC